MALHVSFSIISFVAVPAGSRNIYAWSDEYQAVLLDGYLPEASYFPADYGFALKTLTEFGDPLPTITAVTQATFPGCLVAQRVIGLFRYRVEKRVRDVVVGVPLNDPNLGAVATVSDAPSWLVDGMTNLVRLVAEPHARADGWYSPDEAIEVARQASTRWTIHNDSIHNGHAAVREPSSPS